MEYKGFKYSHNSKNEISHEGFIFENDVHTPQKKHFILERKDTFKIYQKPSLSVTSIFTLPFIQGVSNLISELS